MSLAHSFHPGELEAQRRFNDDWDEAHAVRLGHIIGYTLDQEQAHFIDSLAFFFLSTADGQGHCDCSFKGSEPMPDGQPTPAVWVADQQHLLFPDYAGNRIFNSLGNLIENPHLGLLFINFALHRRLRVNGEARILDGEGSWRSRWPAAPRAVEVSVQQVYWNCAKRIPTHP